MAEEPAAFTAYKKFRGLQLHFSVDTYDYMRYNGQVSIKYETFLGLGNEKLAYGKLSDMRHYEDIIISNMIVDENMTIFDIIDLNNGIQNYREWKKRVDNLTNLFSTDLKKLNKNNLRDDFKFRDNGNKSPIVVEKYMRKQISIETFSILQNITNVTDFFEKNNKDLYLTKKYLMKAKKYYPFLKVDRDKFMNIVKNYMSKDS